MGPHAYPFPDLEYYYFYPHLEAGGLLAVDDIQIPSIHNLYRFLRDEEMFAFDGVVDRTAFFIRTGKPTFDPWADGWWLQRYNRRLLLRHTWLDRIKGAVPPGMRSALRRYADRFRMR